MLILTGSAKAKDAISSPRPALQPTLSLAISALDLPEDALTSEEEAVHAPLISDLMAASSFIPTLTTIAKTPMPRVMPDFPLFKLSAELPTASVSKVLCPPAVEPPRPLSASSTTVLVLEPILNFKLPLVPRL